MRFLILAITLFYCGFASAEESPTRNIYAASYTISPATNQTVTLPFSSRELTVFNGDSTDLICVDLKGGSCNNFCNGDNEFILPATSKIELNSFETSSLTLCGMSASASPVSVVVAY